MTLFGDPFGRGIFSGFLLGAEVKLADSVSHAVGRQRLGNVEACAPSRVEGLLHDAPPVDQPTSMVEVVDERVCTLSLNEKVQVSLSMGLWRLSNPEESVLQPLLVEGGFQSQHEIFAALQRNVVSEGVSRKEVPRPPVHPASPGVNQL